MKSTDRPACSWPPAAFRVGSRTSRLLTLAHLANQLLVSQSTCSDLAAGKLPAVNVGRQSRMSAGALDRAIAHALDAQVPW